MKNSICLPVITSICAALLTGCAGGPQYSDVKQSGALAPHNGLGMILIYRTPGLVSAVYKPYLYVNQVQQPSRLARGGFYSYESAPGLLNVAYSKQPGDSTSKTRTEAVVGSVLIGGGVGGVLGYYGDIDQHRKVGLNINLFPNETRYIVMGGAGGDLKEIPNEKGEEEIKSCHWLNPSIR